MSQLTQDAVGNNPLEVVNACHDRPVLLFSGQGSQDKGMGEDLARADAGAMALWELAERISGLPLRSIYWEGDGAAMSDTVALQPALTVVNINLWRALERHGAPAPLGCAGHSLGEFAALAASGILSDEDALTITSLRGRLMAEADPDGKGGMAAIVKLPVEDVEAIIREASQEAEAPLAAANYNTPEQTVVSGAREAVALAIQKAKIRKGRGVELKVSGAFHSPLMAEANEKLLPALQKATWRDPQFPFYANATGKAVATGAEAMRNMLRQMVSPVYWVELLRSLYLAGARWYVEISPRAVLGKMVGPSLAGIAAQCETLRVDLIHSLNSVLQASF